MSASVFLSYSHADKPVARMLATHLRDQGFQVWIDEGELNVGDSIIERIAAALVDVDFVVALISRNSVSSAWCQKELSLAMTGELARRGIKVLPLRLEEVPMPPTLLDKFYLDVDSNDLISVCQRLASDVRRHTERRSNRSGASRLTGETRIHNIDSAQGLLDQYQDWVDSGDSVSCFGDWTRRTTQQRWPTGIDNYAKFWLNSLAALSGLRADGANPTYIAIFAGTAEKVMDLDDPKQRDMTEMIRRL
jgi:TIR domain